MKIRLNATHLDATDTAAFLCDLSELAEDWGIPEIVVEAETAAELGEIVADDEAEARDTDIPPRCGDLVEIDGFEYVVVQEAIDGSLQLKLAEDSFLGGAVH